MKILLKLLIATTLMLALSACLLYRVDVQQGNEISLQKLNEIEIGMSRDEVVAILGTPLINDPFNTDRWDYYYYLKTGKDGKIETQSATLFFKDGILADKKTKLK